MRIIQKFEKKSVETQPSTFILQLHAILVIKLSPVHFTINPGVFNSKK